MRMSATQASREFSAMLTRVAAGEPVEIHRHGDVIATVVPARTALVRGSFLLALLRTAPRPDEDFGQDVLRLDEVLRPSTDPWQS